jgi:hypothetical protein
MIINRIYETQNLLDRAKDLSAPLYEVGIHTKLQQISGFCRQVHENCALLGYYTVISGNILPTFRDNLLVPSSGGQEEDTADRLSRNVGEKLPLLAV